MLILKIYQVRLSRFLQSQCRSTGILPPSPSSPPPPPLGDQDGDRGTTCPLPKVPPCHGHPAASPISTSLCPGLSCPAPAPPGAESPRCHPRLVSRSGCWFGGVGRGGQELVAGVARGPFRFAFGISVCSSLSLFPLYKMSCMVMGVGDTVTSGSGGRPALTAAGPGSVWTWCHR